MSGPRFAPLDCGVEKTDLRALCLMSPASASVQRCGVCLSVSGAMIRDSHDLVADGRIERRCVVDIGDRIAHTCIRECGEGRAWEWYSSQ